MLNAVVWKDMGHTKPVDLAIRRFGDFRKTGSNRVMAEVRTGLQGIMKCRKGR